MKCDCFREEFGKPVCYGTKEREVCTCDGNENECNFYKSKRKTDKQATIKLCRESQMTLRQWYEIWAKEFASEVAEQLKTASDLEVYNCSDRYKGQYIRVNKAIDIINNMADSL